MVAENDDQLLLYVAGEGGTGKSWIIEAVRIGMKLLGREQEVLVRTCQKYHYATKRCTVHNSILKYYPNYLTHSLMLSGPSLGYTLGK
jgi:hypothetical protein